MGHQLETVHHYPYLGVEISDKLRWDQHIDMRIGNRVVALSTCVLSRYRLVFCRVIALSRYRVVALSRYRVVALSRCRVIALSRCRVIALSRCRVIALSTCERK